MRSGVSRTDRTGGGVPAPPPGPERLRREAGFAKARERLGHYGRDTVARRFYEAGWEDKRKDTDDGAHNT